MAATVPSSTKTIPTVDLSSFANLSDNKTEERKKASKALYDASNELGFAYIKGHGLPPRLLENAFNISRKFFDLPEAEKLKAPHPDGPVPHRGYSRPGLEKVYSKDELEKDKAGGKQGASLRKIQDLKVGETDHDVAINSHDDDDDGADSHDLMTLIASRRRATR